MRQTLAYAVLYLHANRNNMGTRSSKRFNTSQNIKGYIFQVHMLKQTGIDNMALQFKIVKPCSKF